VLARLIPEKGILELVTELAAIRESWGELVVGAAREDERYARRVEQKIAASGLSQSVRLLGPVDDLDAFFDGIDALIVPSTGYEGQPAVIIEGLAYGVPVVVRAPLWSGDFADLPVRRFKDAPSLERGLRELSAELVAPEELARRFGPMQLLEAAERAASAQKRSFPPALSGC
jgi:glycosyltransferase involved in cell wall biosynthesis